MLIVNHSKKMEYYIIENKQKKGPLSISELAQISITRSTLVWKKGQDDWVYATALEELDDIINSSPPPIPNTVKFRFFAGEIKSSLKISPPTLLVFFPLFILIDYLFSLTTYTPRYYNGRWYYYPEFSEYWESNWGAGIDEIIPRILITFLITFSFIVIFKYLFLWLKRVYKNYKMV
jgi:hypothetical protein